MQAGIIDVDLLGCSYQIGANFNHPAYVGAPRKLDRNGAWVVNPGIGIGFDFRKTIADPCWHGIAPITKAIYLKDCDNRTIFMAGAGGRFRRLVYKKLLFDINLLLMAWVGSIWQSNSYSLTFLPFPNISFQYCFSKQLSLGSTFSFIPKNSGMSATSGFHIIFINLTGSISTAKAES